MAMFKKVFTIWFIFEFAMLCSGGSISWRAETTYDNNLRAPMLFSRLGQREVLQDLFKLRLALQTNNPSGQTMLMLQERDFKQRFDILLRNAPYHYDLGKWLLKENWIILKGVLEGKRIAPAYIEIHPSGRCNFNCRWCRGGYRHIAAINDSAYRMDRNILLKLIDDVYSLNPRALIRFSGFVGEPLENPATIDALKRASELNMDWGLATNGSLLTPDVCKVLLDASFVNVSLDAGTSLTHSRLKGLPARTDIFEEILNNIAYLVKLKKESGGRVKIGVSILLQPENWKEMEELSKKLKEIGIDILQLKTAHFDPRGSMSSGEVHEMYEKLRLIKEEHNTRGYTVYIMQEEAEAAGKFARHYEKPTIEKCYAALVQSAMGPDGTVHTCCHYGYGDLGVQGNLVNASLKEIWTNDLRAEITGRNPIGRCKYCAPADAKFNALARLLKDAQSKYPGILEWIEDTFVKGVIEFTDHDNLASMEFFNSLSTARACQ